MPRETKKHAVAIIFCDDTSKTFACESGEWIRIAKLDFFDSLACKDSVCREMLNDEGCFAKVYQEAEE